MRRQCPKCHSFNDDSAAFCAQCGHKVLDLKAPRFEPLDSLQAGPRRPGRLPAALRLLALTSGAVLLLTLAVILWHQSGRELRVQPRRPETLPPANAPAAEVAAPGPGPDAGAEPPPKEEDLKTLSPESLEKLSRSALVALELFDGDGQAMGKAYGVLLEPEGTVLARFRDLLGAYRAQCPLSGLAEPISVRGAVQVDAARNLALLELDLPPAPAQERRSPAVTTRKTSLPALPPLVGEEARASLSPGLQVFLALEGGFELRWGVAAAVSEVPYFLPDQVSCLRLEAGPALSGNPLFAIDAYGYAVGLGRLEEPPSPSEPSRVLIDPLGSLEFALGRPVALSLPQLNAQYYEGTFAAWFAQARKALERKQLAAACEALFRALERAAPERLDMSRQDEAAALLRSALAELEGQLRQKGAWRELARLLESAVQALPQDRELWLELAQAGLKNENYQAAIEAAGQARLLAPGSDVDLLLQESHVKLAARLLALGDSNAAAQMLIGGIGLVPGSAPMHLELAKIYQSWESYDLAVRYFQAARQLDPALTTDVQLYLEKIDDAIKRKEAVIIPIPERATSLGTDVVLNGAAAYRFLIDTGASMTAISSDIAAALGYRQGQEQEWVTVRTANGVIQAPVVLLDSLSIQGFYVRNLKALILPNHVTTTGLVGLNYLNHFKYTVDAGKKEFRLERK
ncbi:MAG: TIGR02281 family clan AA aspartic protease [Planctomycetes bacterium]|nr:TIGR02281 family clan AA aspartic protease [Planctomycetota bacterium]